MRMMHEAHARAMLVAAASCLAVMAYGFADSTAARTGDGMWPAWFLASAASCLALALFPWSRSALLVSGVLVPVGFAAKVAGTIIDLETGLSPDPGRSIAGISLYVCLAMMTATTWVFVLGPVVSWAAQRRRR